eukprot:5477018-Pleurochrysis_carterae.AAC.1
MAGKHTRAQKGRGRLSTHNPQRRIAHAKGQRHEREGESMPVVHAFILGRQPHVSPTDERMP